MDTFHLPVMAKEIVNFLSPLNGKTIVDCTVGGGGHISKLISNIQFPISNVQCPMSNFHIIAIDQDQEALEFAKKRLAKYDNIEYIHDNFGNLANIIKESVDAFLFDLGISSYQIDQASRGFSIRYDAPLDMRMDKSKQTSAREIIHNSSEDELAQIFKEYGEERFSKRVARAIILERDKKEINTTFELKDIIEKAIPTWKKRESVTRIFQALRIAANLELDVLKKALESTIPLLKPEGKIIVMSYHSLEDRIVKWFFRDKAKNGILNILTKKPVLATEEETAINPRAKSAKLRCAEKNN